MSIMLASLPKSISIMDLVSKASDGIVKQVYQVRKSVRNSYKGRRGRWYR